MTSLTIEQLKALFDDSENGQATLELSEPGTPIFRIKSGSQDSTKARKKEIDDLNAQN